MNAPAMVLAVDDDGFVRTVLGRVFANAGIPARTYESAAELLGSGELGPPAALLLLDVMMPGMSGLELQAQLHAQDCRLPVMFLTGRSDIAMAVEAMRNGAVDFVEKPFKNDDLVRRVRRALALGDQAAPHPVAPAPPNEAFMRRLGALTARERQVYDCMIAGKTSKLIARELGGSFRTVEIHRGRVMEKMEAAHLADLVRMAFQVDTAAP
jgi:FixJ family two-component response regulator